MHLSRLLSRAGAVAFCAAVFLAACGKQPGASSKAEATFASLPAAEVFLDGAKIGTTPLTARVAPGTHEVTFRCAAGGSDAAEVAALVEEARAAEATAADCEKRALALEAGVKAVEAADAEVKRSEEALAKASAAQPAGTGIRDLTAAIETAKAAQAEALKALGGIAPQEAATEAARIRREAEEALARAAECRRKIEAAKGK